MFLELVSSSPFPEDDDVDAPNTEEPAAFGNEAQTSAKESSTPDDIQIDAPEDIQGEIAENIQEEAGDSPIYQEEADESQAA